MFNVRFSKIRDDFGLRASGFLLTDFSPCGCLYLSLNPQQQWLTCSIVYSRIARITLILFCGALPYIPVHFFFPAGRAFISLSYQTDFTLCLNTKSKQKGQGWKYFWNKNYGSGNSTRQNSSSFLLLKQCRLLLAFSFSFPCFVIKNLLGHSYTKIILHILDFLFCQWLEACS